MHDDIELIFKYPLTEVTSEMDNIIYKGLINVEAKDYKFHLTKMNNKGYKLKMTTDLLPFKEQLTKMKLSSSDSVTTILDQMKSIILSNIIPEAHSLHNELEIYRKVLYEYSEFTRFYINLDKCTLSCDLRSIQIITSDEQNRKHQLDIKVDYYESQQIFYVEKCILPIVDSTKPLFAKYSTLTELYRQFLNYIENFQEFWDLMDLFDKYSDVIDPEVPTRSHCYRRIRISDDVSIIITVNPFHINSMVDLKFLGPQKVVENYRHKLSNNLETFYKQKNIFKGVLELLDLDKYPKRDLRTSSDGNLLKYEGECSICFSFRLDNKLPEVICQNLSCKNVYHVNCLYEWLISVNSTRLFNEISGQCPNCERNISCPIPT